MHRLAAHACLLAALFCLKNVVEAVCVGLRGLPVNTSYQEAQEAATQSKPAYWKLVWFCLGACEGGGGRGGGCEQLSQERSCGHVRSGQ